MTNDEDSSNFSQLKDSLAQRLLLVPELNSADATASAELDDFVSYLASEIWPRLPEETREASYSTVSSLPDIDELPLDEVAPPTFVETLVSYGICSDDDSAVRWLRKVLLDYVKETCAPPPVWSTTRTKECELCGREVPLTYHHLIPRSTHAKALKKKWHPQDMLNSVAWLCRPCHSAVHRAASNEDLARSYYTLELLLEREDIQKWAKYASKQRYGVRRG
ncbi:hypothetical protein GLOTRDRAFT_79058 [Gloeophyllum trabeum ATCC 11539]|uniref:HNH domain-containing protein n=1 Tax=Gloeophyllum trabeum (strain ATCC 11539 / FP-39264 / Madison 617) TaxID=670483 RepID=S7PZF9_GLOTA|nr:uncharacterized protein GLOTRDRAFT_79058 [Gloeophyllum trabeum ATCC 11539]EPQ53041.1 hypothetical protein GLOTRDRAFT_79058 [Gloeophyllum trabeum ATCC 11539]